MGRRFSFCSILFVSFFVPGLVLITVDANTTQATRVDGLDIASILDSLQINSSLFNNTDINGLVQLLSNRSLSDIFNTGLDIDSILNSTQLSNTDLNDLVQLLSNQSLTNIFNNPEIINSLLSAIGVNSLDNLTSSAELQELLSNGAGFATAAMELLFTSNGIGRKCQSDFFELLSGISSGQLWALQILDSYGKPQPGFLQGDLNWVGNYEQCLDFYTTGMNMHLNPDNPTNFDTQYCRVGIPIGQIMPAGLQELFQSVTLGSCVPDSCSASDVSGIFVAVQSLFNVSEPMRPSVECVENKPIRAREVIVICVLSILGFMVLLGTVYDVIAIQMQTKKASDEIPVKTGRTNHFNAANDVTIQNIDPPSYIDANTISDTKDVNVFINGGYDDAADLNSRPPMTSNGNSVEMTSKQTKVNVIADVKRPVQVTGNTQGTLEKIILSFSVYTNGVKILSTNQGAGSLGAVNGIRFLSMAWVILGHTLAFIPGYSGNAYKYAIQKAMERWSYLAIVNATFSVDSFFTLSGLLVAYLTLKELKKLGGMKQLNWFMFYFHRFWRLTPAYMLVLMSGVVIYPLLVSGPMVNNESKMGNCEEYWWTNILYVNNLVLDKASDACMGWSWYLSNDMQFYILSPILLLPLFYNMYAGITSCLVFLSISMGLAAHVTYINGFRAQSFSPFLPPQDENKNFMDLYLPCYTRMGPYVVGVLTGYILYKWECTCKINKFLNLFLWIISLGSCSAIIYSIYNEWDSHIFTLSESTAYWATSRTGWGFVISWIVFACATGNGGWINEILSWKVFIPLGRLTYCAYLIHPIMIYAYQEELRAEYTLTDYSLAYLFVGHLSFSYGGAFLTSLVFESPMMGLEKAIFKKK